MRLSKTPAATILLVAILVLGACGGGETGVFVIKVAASAPADDPGPLTLQLFVDRINEAAGGRIDARLYAGSALGEDRDVTEGLKLGTVEMLMSPSSTLATFVPEMYVFELPFLFDDNEHMFAVLDSEIGDSLRPALEREGFHLMGYFSYGLRHIMTTERAVESIDDLRGLKIRTMESPPHLDAFTAFGASPLPMAYNELYTSLETGVIDGAEAANSNYYSKRLVAPVLMSKAFYDRLPPDLQELVDTTLMDLVDYERQLYADVDAQRLDQLIKAGVTVTYPDRAAFVAASATVYDAWAERLGGREMIDAILSFPR